MGRTDRMTCRTVVARAAAVAALMAALGGVAFGQADNLGDDDLSTIGRRIVASLTESPPEARRAAKYVATIRDDGSWPDVDYADKSNATWNPIAHLQRLAVVARALAADKRVADGDPRSAALVRGLEYWVRTDPKSHNWWYNSIATPQALGNCLIIAQGHLPADLVRRAQPILTRAWDIRKRMTAQNLVWVSRAALVQACLTGDQVLARQAVAAIAGTVVVTGAEGIQADWSFHQHGPQLYSGGYGMGFSSDCAAMAQLVHGTSLAFSDEQVATLSHYVLDGQQWMAVGPAMDPSTMGREIVRGAVARRAATLRSVCRRMAEVHPARRREYEAMLERLEGRAAPLSETGPQGNRFFWQSDYMVHRGSGGFISIRMHSKRTLPSETINGENLFGWHLADGVTYVMTRGDEYGEAFPAWNWRRVPGVTSRQREGKVPALSRKARNTRDFVGGVSDGRLGLAAMDFDRDGVVARKAWFCLGDGTVLALGAGIRSTSDDTIATSINQCPRRGAIRYRTSGSDAEQVAPDAGEVAAEGVSQVRHDGVTYRVLDGVARMEVRQQEGSWRRISRPRPAGAVKIEMVTLWLEHGRRPDGATYGYAIVPGPADSNGAAAHEAKILANRPDVQAAHLVADRCVAAAFYKAGRIDAGDGRHLTVDRPCLALWNVAAGTLWVSDPTQTLRQVTVTLGVGGSAVVRRVDLPTGLAAGSSAKVTARD